MHVAADFEQELLITTNCMTLQRHIPNSSQSAFEPTLLWSKRIKRQLRFENQNKSANADDKKSVERRTFSLVPLPLYTFYIDVLGQNDSKI